MIFEKSNAKNVLWRGKSNLSLITLFHVLLLAPILLLGGLLTLLGFYSFAAIAAGILFAIVLILRQDAITVTLLAALHLYVDWYLGLHLFAPVLAVGALCIFYTTRSADRPWTKPAALWLWIIFLVITIYPAARGGVLMLYDAASFYPSDIFGAFLMFWLGGLLAGNTQQQEANLRRFFAIFTVLAVLLAFHTLIQSLTSTILFSSSRVDDFLSRPDILSYQLPDTDTHRAGSFFIDPNWNGAFFSLVSFLPLALFVNSTTLFKKLCSLAALVPILLALMCTYSTGSWIAFLIGLLTFVVFVGRARYRMLLPVFVLLAAITVVVVFPAQLALQLQHAQGNNELSLRFAVWQTALRVIQAYPLTGVGLGHRAYLTRADSFRVPAQFVSLSHPHDSYLEWAAMAGIPVLLVFLALLLVGLWLAWRNWRLLSCRMRPLIGGGIASTVALSVNSISINGWTHFALALIGWLILGVVASPLIGRNMQAQEANYVKIGLSE